MMTGFTEQYLTPCALALGAGTSAIGALAACTNFVAAWSQLFTTFWVRRFHSRRRFIVMGASFQALLLLPMAILPFLPVGHKIVTFLLLAIFFVSSGAMIAPAWGSLMTDHVEAESRGDYFGWRNQRLGIIVVSSSLLAGVILYTLHAANPLAGFTVIFCCAMFARFVSAYFLSRMEDIPFNSTEAHDFTLWMFLSRFRQSNFVRFVFFVSSMTFATQIAGPFFSVYMLRDLHFNYLLYTGLVLGATISTLIGMRLWGAHADRVGNARVLRLTAMLIPAIPIAWSFFVHPVALILVEVFAGFVWGGFNLAASNFIYDAVTPPKRIRCIAYFNVINGTALALAAVLGGYLASHLPLLHGHRLPCLFLLSGCLRMLVVLFLGTGWKEVRPTQQVSSLDLFFSVVGIRSVLGSRHKQELS